MAGGDTVLLQQPWCSTIKELKNPTLRPFEKVSCYRLPSAIWVENYLGWFSTTGVNAYGSTDSLYPISVVLRIPEWLQNIAFFISKTSSFNWRQLNDQFVRIQSECEFDTDEGLYGAFATTSWWSRYIATDGTESATRSQRSRYTL